MLSNLARGGAGGRWRIRKLFHRFRARSGPGSGRPQGAAIFPAGGVLLLAAAATAAGRREGTAFSRRPGSGAAPRARCWENVFLFHRAASGKESGGAQFAAFGALPHGTALGGSSGPRTGCWAGGGGPCGAAAVWRSGAGENRGTERGNGGGSRVRLKQVTCSRHFLLFVSAVEAGAALFAQLELCSGLSRGVMAVRKKRLKQ